MEMGLPRYDEVSIHALLAECDAFFVHRYYLTPAVSIHALLAECDPCCGGV